MTKTNYSTRCSLGGFLRLLKVMFLVVLGTLFSMNVNAQVSVTATAGTVGPTSYTTLNSAFTAINAGTHQGAITVTITANTTEPATPVALLKSAAPSSYTSILIQPSGNVTINSAAAPTASRGIIELSGADNVTIDGDDPSTGGTQNLTIQAATVATTGVTCVRLSSNSTTGTDGADNNTVKNCIIIGSRNSVSSTVVNYGINMSNWSSTSMTTGAYSSLNTVIQNNAITRCWHAIYANGSSSTYPNTGTQIIGNTIGSSTAANIIGARGIFMTYSAISTGGAIIRNNDIQAGDPGTTGYTGTVAGIELGTNNTGTQVYANNIHEVRQPTTSGYHAAGILISGSTNTSGISIYNNFIRDMVASLYTTTITTIGSTYGIYFSVGATNVSIDHNTIVLNTNPTTGTTTNHINACVAMSVNGVTLTSFRNNILVNTLTSTNSYGVWCNATTNISAGTVNNNDYYVPNGKIGYYNAADRSTLSAWQTATSKDANSLNLNAGFVSTTNLHIDNTSGAAVSLNGAGATGLSVTTDIDGATRSATPDIGADEFDLPVGLNVGASAVVNPTAITCHSAAENLTIRVKNYGATAHDFSVDPVTVTASVTGAITDGPFTVTLNSGTLAAGATQDVVVGTINTTANGTYSIAASAVVTGDINTANDATSANVVINYTTLSTTATATPASLCNSGTSVIAAVPVGGSSPYTYVWNGGATTQSFTSATLVANTTFTVTVTDACGITATNNVSVSVNAPIVTGITAGTRCGTGTVSLGATGSAGTTLKWYAAASGGSALGTGASFTTPSITSTTPYYVGASVEVPNSTVTIGAGATTTSSSASSPYYHGYGGQKSQFIILASELAAAGMSAGNINSVSFEITSLGTTTLNGFGLAIGHTSQNAAVSNTAITGLTDVYTNAAQTLTTGVNTYTFSAPFTWNGTSNIVVQVCYSNNNSGGTSSTVKADVTAFNASLGIYADNATSSAVCAATTSTGLGSLSSNGTSTTRPRMIFNATGVCESARASVTATVTAPPSISASATSSTICVGQSTILNVTSTNDPDYTYTWNGGAGSGASVSVSPSANTTYTVSALDNTAGPNAGCATSATVSITVNPNPSAVTVTPSTSTMCVGGSQTLTAAGGTIGGAGNATIGTATTLTTANGTEPTAFNNRYAQYWCQMVYTAAELQAQGLTAGSQITSIGFTTTTQGDASTNDNFRIYMGTVGSTSTLTGFTTSGLTLVYGSTSTTYTHAVGLNTITLSAPFTWNGTSNLLVDLRHSGVDNVNNAITYYTATGTNTVWNAQTSTAFSTSDYSTTAPAGAGSVKRLNTVFGYSSLVNPTWSWSPNTASTAVVSVSPSSATTYTATATINGCTATGSALVNVSDLAVTASATDAACFGASTGSVTGSASLGAGSYTYSLNGSTYQAGATFTSLAAGTYTVYAKDANNCVVTASATIGEPATAVSFDSQSSTAPTCHDGTDGSISFSAIGGTGTISYTVNGNPATSPVTGLAAGSYAVVATDANGCSASTSITVTNPAAPSVTASNNSPICDGSSATLDATAGFTSYAWSGPNSFSASTQSASATDAGVYTVLVTDANGCTNSASTTLVVNPIIPVSVSIAASPSLSICTGTSVTFTATPTNGGSAPAYQWYLNGVAQSGETAATYTSSSLVDADQVYVTLSSDVTCPSTTSATSNTLTITVTGAISASATISESANNVCAGTSVTYTVAQTGGGSTPNYEFFVNSTSVQNGLGNTYSYVPANGDVVYAIMTSSFACATGSPYTTSSITMTINALPSAPSITAGGATSFCPGGSVTLTSSYTGGNVWSTTETTDAITVSASGSYTVTYTDGNGCTSASSAPEVVTVFPANSVSISASGATDFCNPGSVTLTSSVVGGNVWSTTETTDAITVSASGTYSVTNTDANGCTATASQVVNSVDAPTVSIAANCTSILAGNSATLTATATTSFGTITTYQWVLNGSTNVGTNSATFNASTGGSYTCIVTNSTGCTATSNAIVVDNSTALNGAYTIGGSGCDNFTSFANAFAALNARGVSGNVTVTVAAGYTETAPAGGLALNMCSLGSTLVPSATQTITFISAGAPNPVITAGVGTTTNLDAIVKLVGVDYVTFNGINLTESAGNTTSTTRAEWGYALLKCDGNNGANFNTIINCSVTLSKANTASVGIYSGNHTAANTTGLTYTGLANDPAQVDASRNGHNTFYGNAIQNVYRGISLNGNSSGSGNQSCNDTLNAIGVIGQSANVITDFGGGATACTVIGSTNQRGITIDNNSITGGTGTTASLAGINPGAGVWGKIRNNTINLTYSGTTTTTAVQGINISYSGGSLVNPNIVEVTGNAVTIGSATLTTGTSSAGIVCTASGTGAQINVSNNTVTGCSFPAATSAPFTAISMSHASASTTNIVSNNTVTSNSLAGTGTFLGVAAFNTTSAVVSGTLTESNNVVSSNTKSSTGSMFCVYNAVGTGSSLSMTQNGNTVNGNVIAGGAAACTLVGITAQATTFTMNANTVTNNSVTTVSGTAAGNVLAIQSSGASTTSSAITNNTVNGVTLGGVSSGASLVRGILATTAASDARVISGNDISNVNTSFTTSATCIGIILGTGGNTDIKNNKIYNFTPGQNGTVFSGAKGIVISGGSTTNVFNNLVGFDYTASTPVLVSNNSVVGLEVTAGTTANLYYNTIRLAGSGSGTGFGSSGINLTTTATNVDIRNNIVSNTMNGGGATAAAASVGLRRSATALTGYAATSNNNLWFTTAIPAAATALYFDGTTAYASLAAFKAQVASRESNSVSEDITPSMISTSGASADFLHITAGAATLAESGGSAIAGITTDYDGNTRATTPDIGADEFAGTAIQPYITSVTASPSTTVSCTATARTVTAVIVGPVNPITGATLNYSFNGTAQTPVSMTNTSGNIWEGVIPAATPGNATVAYSVVGTDGTYNPTFAGTSYKDEPLTGYTATATSSPATICEGSSSNLTFSLTTPGNATVGTGTTLSSATSYPTAFGNYWDQTWQQYLYTAAELHAMGLSAGDITSIKFNIAAVPSPNSALTDYNVKIGSTGVTALSSFQTTGLTNVFGPASKTAAAGVNTITFTTPYNWDGVSNIVVDLRMTEFYGNGNATTYCTPTTNNSVLYAYASSSNASFWTSNPTATTSTTRPNIVFSGITEATPSSITWSDGSSTLGSTSTISVSPLTTTSYSVVATDANGCSISASTSVTVNPLPPTPTATDGSQCGTQTPSCSVSGVSGNTFRWYTVPTGGTAIAGQTGSTLIAPYTIAATTVYYVSQIDAATGCESPRVMVTQTVTVPDAVTASVSVNNVCPGSSVDLIATQSGSTQVYTYTWNGSGVTAQVGQTVTFTAPSTAGTYTYSLNAVDGGCAATATVSLTVIAPPSITYATSNLSTVCEGASVVLTAVTGPIPSTSPSAYTFAQSAGTFTAITGTTSTATGDDGTQTGIPIGFNFTYNGATRTTFGISTNGTIQLGTTATSYSNALASNVNVLAPLWDDNNLGTGTIKYETTGTAPNRVLTVEWNGIAIGGSGSSTNPTGSFQVQLFETSNIVKFNYGTISAMSSVSASIGISGSVGSYLSVTPGAPATAATSPENTTISANTFLASGTVYTFTPPAQPGAGSLSWTWNPGAISGNSVTVNPTTTTTYTVTATDPVSGCTASSNVLITVNPLPIAPTASNSTQCGNGIPTCSVSTTESGVIFNWYSAAIGGTLIQSGASTLTSTSISATTTFYVSAMNVSTSCEGPRTAVLAEVVQPDVVTASASASTICLGASVDLSVSQTGTTNTYTYTWNGAAGSGITTPLTGASQTVTPTVAGSYVYTVNAVDGGCTTSSTVTVNVSALPNVSTITATPSTICEGGSSTLSATSLILTTGPQTAPLGYCSNGGSTVTFGDEQIFGVTFGSMSNIQSETCTSNYGNYTSSVPAPTVYANQSVPFSVITDECDGSTYYFSGLSIYIDYNRDGDFDDAGEQAYTTSTTTQSPNTRSGNILIPATASAGVTRMRVVVIENSASPVACPSFSYGEVEDYNINIIGAVADPSATFAWNPGSLSGASVSVTPATTTTYSLTVTNAAGCTSTSSVTVNVNPVPTAPNTTASTQCGNGIPTASVASTSGEPTPIYSWYTAATGGSPIQQSTSNTLTSTSISVSTTFYVSEIYPLTGCESPRASVFAEVIAPDAITANASSATICLGSTLDLSVTQTGTTNTYIYTWNGTAGSGITSPLTGGSQTITPTAVGTYVYTLNAVDGSCNTASSVTVTVNALPTIYSATSSSSTACLGTSVTLSAYAGDNAAAPTTYCATSNAGGAAITSVTFNTLSRTSGALTTSPYYESVPEGTATTALVPGSTYTFSVSTPNDGIYAGGIVSVWIDWDRDGVLASTEWYQPYTSAESGSVSITVPVTATSGKTLMRVRSRGAGNTNGATDACLTMGSGETEDYTVSILSAGGSFIWTDGTSTVSTSNPATITPTATGTYYAVLTGANGCTSTSSGVTVTVITTPDVPAVTQSADTVCVSGDVNFAITNSQGGVSYQWQSSSTGLAGSFSDISGATGITYSVTGLATTTYYQVVATCGLNSSTSSTMLVYRSAPATVSTVGATRCGPGDVTVSATGVGSFEWYAGSVSTTVLGTGSSFTTNLAANTTLWVIAHEGTCYETARTPVSVTINTPPAIVATSSAASICAGQSATLSVTSANTNYSYSWNGTPGGAAGTGSSVSVTPASSTVYTVTATDGSSGPYAGCNAVQNVTVVVNALPVISSITTSATSICDGSSFQMFANTDEAGPQTQPSGYDNTSTSSSQGDEQIFAVSFGTMNNVQSETCTTGYSDYTSTIAAPLVARGATVPFSVTEDECDGATYYSNGLSIFIDYNRDGDFDDAGEQAYTSNATSAAATGAPNVRSGNIVIPVTASLGVTRMRVVVAEGVSAPLATGDNFYGETEDYVINIGSTYTYSWSPATNLSSATVSNPTVSTLSGSQTYSVTATNSFGCSSTSSITVTSLALPTPTLTVADGLVLCSPDNVDIYAADLTGPYASGYPTGTTVEWLGYGIIGAADTTFVNSTAGSTFQAKITLPNGCFANSNIITVETRTVAVNPVVTPAACGNNNGKVLVTISSAPAAPYRYIWTDGTTTIRDVTNSASSDSIYGLGAGTYYLSIYDNVGGSLSCSTLNIPYVVGASSAATLTMSSTNVTCNGLSDGTVSVTASGGATPYTYLWDNGSNPTLAAQNSLGGGVYNVLVTDALGCTASGTVTVTEPTAIVATFTVDKPCSLGTNGSITATVTGGTGTYATLEWYNQDFSSDLGPGLSVTGLSAGDYNYVVVDDNGCSPVLGPFIVSVLDIPAIVVSTITPSTAAVGATVTLSGTGFTGATGVSFNGTAATVYSVIDDNTISVTVPAGTTDGPVTVSVGGCTGVSGGSFTVQNNATFNLKAYMQGYYIGSGAMTPVLNNIGESIDPNEVDTVTVQLRDQFDPTIIVSESKAVIHVDGTATFTYPGSVIGGNYYIAVFHRNTVETWSKLPVSFSGTTTYDFTTASTQAYDDGVNSPMVEVEPGVWAIYQGDVNHDGTVDALDMNEVEFDANQFAFGYNVTDVNGDGGTDALDMNIVEINSGLFLFTAHP